MTTTRKQVPEIILCVLLTLIIIGAAVVGYAHRQKLWMFAEEIPAVGMPVEAALIGAADGAEPGWHYAFAPSYIREKAYYTPEAIAWPAEYYYYHNVKFDKSIASDVTEGEFPVLLQWDKRWGYELYGTNFMGNNGCGPTALAIVYAGLTGNTDWNPYSLAMYSIDNGLYVPNVGTKWVFMEEGGSYLGLTVDVIGEDLELARPALEAGKVLICKVAPGDFTSGGHFIVVTRMLEDNQVEVRDPNSRNKSLVTWDYDRIIGQTDYVWAYSVAEQF